MIHEGEGAERVCVGSLSSIQSTTPTPWFKDVLHPTASTQHPPVAWVLLVLGRRVGEGRHVFVHEGAKAQPEVAGELPHLQGQFGAQVTDGVQVVLHGQRQVHQVVEIHRVVLHLPHLQAEPGLVS